MSLRVKAALVIMSIIFVFTAANYFSNLTFTRQQMTQAMEQDLALAIAIADDLVSTRIRLLHADAETVAERLLKVLPGGDMEEAMASQLELYPDFISFTVHNREGVLANYGEPIDHFDLAKKGHYIQAAFSGFSIIGTTYHSSVTGAFLMNVFVPMGTNMVLSANIPGMFFSDIVAEYRLWKTGSIYILDGEGTFIAMYLSDLVLERRNFIRDAWYDPDLASAGKFMQKILLNDHGSGTYFYMEMERLCIFQHLSGSNAGWCIAVSAPLRESPEAALQQGLLLASLFFLAIGIIVSIFVSALAVKPFYKIKAQNKTLAELNKTVQAASEEKTKFLAKMSHEMRTPLNAVIGLSELTLDDETLSDDSRQNLEKVYNAGSTLLSTVNDILDISKVEAGKFELIPVVYDTPSMINDAITQSILRRGEKPIEFALEIDENIPTTLIGDDLRVKQVLNNLLSNAFKYTREGTVELTVRCEPPPAAGAHDTIWLDVSVRDTGIGIRQGDMDNLFSEYVQVDTQSHRKIEGTGLGLSLTKKMVEIMGGSISVESVYGKGSLFSITIPQKTSTAAVIGPEVVRNLKNLRYPSSRRDMNSRMLHINLSYAKVLVVDDVPTNLDVTRGMMKPYKMQVDCVMSGQEAIDIIRAEKVRYNAIFMDHMMPGMDGIEATRIIREEIGTEYAQTVPIIALTANAIVGNEEMFLSKGFQAFLSKPIEIRLLDGILKQWVRNKELEEELAAQESAEEKLPRERRSEDRRKGGDRRVFARIVQGLDVRSGLKRFGGDSESYLEVLRSFVTNTRPLLETVKNLSRENLKNYAITVHGIKGSCRGICAEKAGDMAEALEMAAKDGDFDFVQEHNLLFIDTASKLIAELGDALNELAVKQEKTQKKRPDTEALERLLAACKNYDVAAIDAVIKEIDHFVYETDDGLVSWLKENVEQMNYADIVERLSHMQDTF